MFTKSNPLRISVALAIVGTLVAFQNCSPSSLGQATQSSEDPGQEIIALSKALTSDAPEDRLLKAQERQKLLLDLAEKNPSEVLRLAMSEEERRNMPDDVQKHIEERLQVEGQLEMYFEDYEDARHVTRHMVKLQDDSRYELRFAKENFPKDFQPGRRISVEGLKIPRDSKSVRGDLVVEDPSKNILMLADDGSGSGLAMDVSTAYSLGAQRTLVILVNFQEDPNNKPWTVSDVNAMVFGTMNDYIKENSYQQSWVIGAVAGWYTIPVSNTTCDGFAIQNYGKSAAQAAGFVLSNYDRFIFAFPKAACGFAGMAQVGAFPSTAWINGYMTTLKVVGHEFIHNLGSMHAHSKDCGNGAVLGSFCFVGEYGNNIDIMGNTNAAHVNAHYKERLSWLTASNITTVTTSGDYFIQPSSLASDGIKALKIYKGLDSISGKPIHYYLEFRQPIGFDGLISTSSTIDTSNIFNGILINEIKPTQFSWYDSYLLDMTPGSDLIDMKDAALMVGKVFSDPEAGIRVTPLSVSSQGASVRVEVGLSLNSTPDTTPPVVQISNPLNGAAVSGSISIKASATDNISLVKIEIYVDGQLKGSNYHQTTTYANIDTTLLSNGSHSIVAKGIDNSNNIGSTQITVNVSNGSVTPTPTPTPDTTLPNVSITSPANGATVSGIISVIASASDNVSVSKVEFYVDGVLKLSDTTATHSMSLDTKTLVNGTHTLMAKAYDSSNNSRTAQISVNVSNSTSDMIAPTVSITSPGNGAVLSPRTTITIQASAFDNVKVSRVEFYVNGGLICSDSAAAYSCSYKVPGAKGASYAVEARAFDSSGNMTKHQISVSTAKGSGK